jgi:NAD(P)H dehydrogenase (quinone)
LNYAFLQKVLQGSNENPHINEIQVLDLYEEGFNPVLVFNEQKRRRDMHTDPGLDKYRRQIMWADKIVFIYPIWWGRPPAMLMGFIDQLFASNFAYKDKKGYFPAKMHNSNPEEDLKEIERAIDILQQKLFYPIK